MKTSVWFLTFEFLAICLVSWILSSLLVSFAMHDLNREPQAFTKLVLFPNTWILFCPVPWLICAVVWSRRGELSRTRMLLFQSTVLAATILLLCVVVVACTLPFMANDRPLPGDEPTTNGGGE
jgi:hypothetical protein